MIMRTFLDVYKRQDKGKERVFNHPLYHILHDEPNEEMTSFVFREVLMSHLLIWGNAYAQIIRDGRGYLIGKQEEIERKTGIKKSAYLLL